MSGSSVLRHSTEVLCALLIAACILLASSYGADQLRSSQVYSQSRLISMIFSQDEVNLTDLVADRQNIDMLVKFVGAATSAYINFELIPVNEASTFVAVFESATGLVQIDHFEYHRKNLTIAGTADTRESYGTFLTGLRNTEHFESVSGHYYVATDDTIRFEVECTARYNGAYLDFG